MNKIQAFFYQICIAVGYCIPFAICLFAIVFAIMSILFTSEAHSSVNHDVKDISPPYIVAELICGDEKTIKKACQKEPACCDFIDQWSDIPMDNPLCSLVINNLGGAYGMCTEQQN